MKYEIYEQNYDFSTTSRGAKQEHILDEQYS